MWKDSDGCIIDLEGLDRVSVLYLAAHGCALVNISDLAVGTTYPECNLFSVHERPGNLMHLIVVTSSIPIHFCKYEFVIIPTYIILASILFLTSRIGSKRYEIG